MSYSTLHKFNFVAPAGHIPSVEIVKVGPKAGGDEYTVTIRYVVAEYPSPIRLHDKTTDPRFDVV